MNKKIAIIAILILVFVIFMVWVWLESTKPLPGELIKDLGREHVEIGKEVSYNSNPPTSGPHYTDWIRPGVYETDRDDRYLVHSMEHGYVVMWYRCDLTTQSPNVKTEEATGSSDATPSAEVSPKECEERKNHLTEIYEKKGKKKLIVMPRENLEANFALTSWNYIDKFNDFDGKRIEKFIDGHLNKGPEKTME